MIKRLVQIRKLSYYVTTPAAGKIFKNEFWWKKPFCEESQRWSLAFFLFSWPVLVAPKRKNQIENYTSSKKLKSTQNNMQWVDTYRRFLYSIHIHNSFNIVVNHFFIIFLPVFFARISYLIYIHSSSRRVVQVSVYHNNTDAQKPPTGSFFFVLLFSFFRKRAI